jgi:hypothetical protein
MTGRFFTKFLALSIAMASVLVAVSPMVAEAQARDASDWVVPRTPDGHPDLQGNWSNATLTPLSRPGNRGPTLTPEEVRRIEEGREALVNERAEASDPDREAPPPGGTNPICIDAATTCYNQVYIDAGSRVAVVNGEARSSLVTIPANGRVPPRTDEARERSTESFALMREFGPYDHPEVRPVAERCLISFGSNAGPPMLPNGWYNNNYTIVQTPDHVLIMAEMVHDARIIKMGDGSRLPPEMRPWLGDSWGHWEGDVLVVETTNLHPMQQYTSAAMKVTERFSRVAEDALLYEFLIDDPSTYTEPWGGQVPMLALGDKLFEYACHEGNYALSNILQGARYEERMDAQEQTNQQTNRR